MYRYNLSWLTVVELSITFINKKTALRSSYSTFMQIMHISHILKACIVEEFALISSTRHPKLPSLVRSSCMPHERNVLLFKSIETRPNIDRPKYIKWFRNKILTWSVNSRTHVYHLLWCFFQFSKNALILGTQTTKRQIKQRTLSILLLKICPTNKKMVFLATFFKLNLKMHNNWCE